MEARLQNLSEYASAYIICNIVLYLGGGLGENNNAVRALHRLHIWRNIIKKQDSRARF
jgi:hypothetical protein